MFLLYIYYFYIKVFLYKKILYNIEIWDTSRKLEYIPILNIFIKRAQIVFILFNYNNRKTFDLSKSLLDKKIDEQQVFALIAAKYDLKFTTKKEDNIVDEEEVLELANKKNALYAHLSLLENYANCVNELLKKSFDVYIKRKLKIKNANKT